MASVAAHPFMGEALRSLPIYAHAWYHLSKHNTVLSSTGSTYVWALFMRWPDAEADPPALMQAREQMTVPATQIQNRCPRWQDFQNTIVLRANADSRSVAEADAGGEQRPEGLDFPWQKKPVMPAIGLHLAIGDGLPQRGQCRDQLATLRRRK